MITALLFDFGGTLDGPTHWLDRFLDRYLAAGIEISREELDPAFDHANRAGYRAGKVMQRFGLNELVRFLVGNQFEYLRKEGSGRIRAMLETAGAQGRYRTVEEMTAAFASDTGAGLAHSRGVLEDLKARYRLGVVSNFYGNLDRILAEARLDKLFDAMIDSSRIGIFKPEPGIFAAALKALKVAPSGAAMVGDSIEKDCAPAHRLGLKTVWYRPSDQFDRGAMAPKADARVDYTIHALGELKSIKW